MDLTDEQLAWCVDTLGVSAADFVDIRQAVSDTRAKRLLDALKAKAKKNYKVVSRKLHPDLTGNDAEKTARFQWLTQVYKDLLRLEVPKRVALPSQERYRRPQSATVVGARFTVRVRYS